MVYQILCVKDRVAEVFGRPMFEASVGSAARSFVDELKNKDSALSRHPEDYDLYHLGTYGDGDASFVLFGEPRKVVAGSEAVK